MRDKELQKLVDAAARTKQQQHARAATRDKGPPPPPNPVRFMVYKRMHHGGMSFLWFLPGAVVLGLIMFADRPWFRYGAAAWGIAFAIRLTIYTVGLLRGYAQFKRFPADLDVTLEGWYPMLDEQLLKDPEEWQTNSPLEVERRAAADAAPVAAALDLCLPRANGWFYSSDKGFDSRVPWKRTGTRVSGSLNVWVLGALYRLIQQLDWVHRRAGGIARISVTKSGSISSYSRPSAD